jgi:hypothetical protein
MAKSSIPFQSTSEQAPDEAISIPNRSDDAQSRGDDAQLLSHFSVYYPFLGHILCCAWCHEDYLHHQRIDYFEPHQEDSKNGLHVILTTGDAPIIDTSMEGNRSQRRGSIVVTFDCEMCNKITELVIIQHKGNSYLDVLRG